MSYFFTSPVTCSLSYRSVSSFFPLSLQGKLEEGNDVHVYLSLAQILKSIRSADILNSIRSADIDVI